MVRGSALVAEMVAEPSSDTVVQSSASTVMALLPLPVTQIQALSPTDVAYSWPLTTTA